MKPLAWAIAHHLTALAETENNPEYLKKAMKIIDIFFDDENKDDLIKGIYNN